MKRAYLFIMGFTQHIGKPDVGIMRMWQHARQYSSPDVLVMTPLPWDSPWEHVAGFVNHLKIPELYVFAYSWGAGWGVPRLLEHLDNPVKYVLAIDPVYRSRILPSWIPFNPLSLTGLFSVKYPANKAEEVKVFRQKTKRPFGRLVEGVKNTFVYEPLFLPHDRMDDAPVVQQTAIEKINETEQRSE